MNWTRSETLALASPRCTFCHGLGLVQNRKRRNHPAIVYCGRCFVPVTAASVVCPRSGPDSRATLEFNSEHSGRSLRGRKLEEYTAHFYLVSKRTLSAEEFRIFRYHFMLGADWHLCCRKLKMDRGLFFHAVYRIERTLGRVFRELQPYGLYPLDEYFNPALLSEGCFGRIRKTPSIATTRPRRSARSG